MRIIFIRIANINNSLSNLQNKIVKEVKKNNFISKDAKTITDTHKLPLNDHHKLRVK